MACQKHHSHSMTAGASGLQRALLAVEHAVIVDLHEPTAGRVPSSDPLCSGSKRTS